MRSLLVINSRDPRTFILNPEARNRMTHMGSSLNCGPFQGAFHKGAVVYVGLRTAP